MEFMEMGSLEKIIDAYPKVKMTEKQIAYVCFEVTPPFFSHGCGPLCNTLQRSKAFT